MSKIIWNRELLLALAFYAGGTSSVAAQWPAQITPGVRVQARLPEQQYQMSSQRGLLIRGRVTRLAADTLYLAVADSLGPLAIPRPHIQRLEISRGVPSRGTSALRQGLISGIGLALTTGIFFEIDSGGDDFADGALIGGAVGLGLGALFGALHPNERWKRVRSGF